MGDIYIFVCTFNKKYGCYEVGCVAKVINWTGDFFRLSQAFKSFRNNCIVEYGIKGALDGVFYVVDGTNVVRGKMGHTVLLPEAKSFLDYIPAF